MSTNHSNKSSGKCCSGVLHRFLCPGSLQTYPSDNYLSELDKIEFSQTMETSKTESCNQVTPGVVARLMGLDSMPDLNWVPKSRTSLDWTMRSRSVGYADYLPNFDLAPKSVHRRVRTSVSFREVPSHTNHSNHDFVVFCFDKDGEIRSNAEIGMRKGNAEKRKNEKDVKERNILKRRENQETIKKASGKKVNSSKPQNITVHKKDDQRKVNGNFKGKSPLKPLNQQRKRSELSNSKSVNSVASTSGAKEKIPRKKPPRKAEKLKKSCSNSVQKGKVDDQEIRAINKKVEKRLSNKIEDDYYSKVSVNIHRLTEIDTNASKWSFESRNTFKYEQVEFICAELDEEIFQNLVIQIVNELSEYMKVYDYS